MIMCATKNARSLREVHSTNSRVPISSSSVAGTLIASNSAADHSRIIQVSLSQVCLAWLGVVQSPVSQVTQSRYDFALEAAPGSLTIMVNSLFRCDLAEMSCAYYKSVASATAR